MAFILTHLNTPTRHAWFPCQNLDEWSSPTKHAWFQAPPPIQINKFSYPLVLRTQFSVSTLSSPFGNVEHQVLLDVGKQPPVLLPYQLRPIAKAIEESRNLLSFEKDWDDEDSPPFTPITRQRTIDFLLKHALAFWEDCGFVLPAPLICPGPAGRLELLWKNENYRLLVSFSAEADEPPPYYGDYYRRETFEGTFDPKLINYSLFAFLTAPHYHNAVLPR